MNKNYPLSVALGQAWVILEGDRVIEAMYAYQSYQIDLTVYEDIKALQSNLLSRGLASPLVESAMSAYNGYQDVLLGRMPHNLNHSELELTEGFNPIVALTNDTLINLISDMNTQIKGQQRIEQFEEKILLLQTLTQYDLVQKRISELTSSSDVDDIVI